jgi:hypothetical protein
MCCHFFVIEAQSQGHPRPKTCNTGFALSRIAVKVLDSVEDAAPLK